VIDGIVNNIKALWALAGQIRTLRIVKREPV
jgi:hypothetical protein